MDVTFKAQGRLNPIGIAEALHSPVGPLGRRLSTIGRAIADAGRAQVGKDTLALMNSIYHEIDMTRRHPQLIVGARDPIAYIHHEGTRPHAIVARNAQMLRFSSRGRIQYARAVMHPGTHPNRFLTDNLYLAK